MLLLCWPRTYASIAQGVCNHTLTVRFEDTLLGEQNIRYKNIGRNDLQGNAAVMKSLSVLHYNESMRACSVRDPGTPVGGSRLYRKRSNRVILK